jgi:hypothetical protein
MNLRRAVRAAGRIVMPSPDPVRRGRRGLVLEAALFLVPLAGAFWLYYGGMGWRPSGGTQWGDLIDPARPLPRSRWRDADGRALSPELLRHWLDDGLHRRRSLRQALPAGALT